MVPRDMLMCRTHWHKVPWRLRKAVWEAWDDGRGAESREHNAAILAAIKSITGGR